MEHSVEEVETWLVLPAVNASADAGSREAHEHLFQRRVAHDVVLYNVSVGLLQPLKDCKQPRQRYRRVRDVVVQQTLRQTQVRRFEN